MVAKGMRVKILRGTFYGDDEGYHGFKVGEVCRIFDNYKEAGYTLLENRNGLVQAVSVKDYKLCPMYEYEKEIFSEIDEEDILEQ